MGDVAAFDFDGTITHGGSVFDFLCVVRGRAAVLAASLALAPRLAHAALVGGRSADEAKELLFERLLDGVEATRYQALAAEFAERHLRAHLREDVRRRIAWHRDRDDAVVVVSASLDAYVRVAAARLEATETIATVLAVGPDGRLTGRYEGANCRGYEKVRRLRAWMDASGHAGDRLWAYGNSRGDLSMLEAADVGVNVGRLGRLGRLRAYPGLAASATADRA